MELELLVPAQPSGGWDLTARAMASTLMHLGIVDDVQIEYSPGAGGVIGLAQFVSSAPDDRTTLFIGGTFTIGAVVQNRAAISLLDTTPIARLTFDNAVVAVPADSQFKSADDLIEVMISSPESISWVGGSRAGVDEINLHEIARALGIAPRRLHYTGLPGGGEAGAALAESKYQVGISGYSEFRSRVEEGDLRIIAVLSESTITGIDAPSFSELGITIKRLNWRGVFGAPDMSEEEVANLTAMIESMAKSEAWQRVLQENHWLDGYLAGDGFVEFVAQEQARVAADIELMQQTDPEQTDVINKVLFRRYAWALGLAALSLLLLGGMAIQRRIARQREAGLQQAYEEATGKALLHVEKLERAMVDIHLHIKDEFQKWDLTAAEREIAMLLLKGLRLKEIADARGTSERTVRQQAQTVYKKAGLAGRFELAAYFIEDVMQSMELAEEQSSDRSHMAT